MNLRLIILFSLLSTYGYSQTIKVETVIIDSGIVEFEKQAKSDTPDYSIAYRILNNQVKLDPKNAELRYYLGYTIDRINADDGEGMNKVKREMTVLASEQFEEVIRLEPLYQGKIVILDPYAKLSSVWGSLAQAYLTRKQFDSAKWAFSEGKKRGGFTEPILEFNRQLLNSCEQNAIVITYGDILTIPIWYLQTIEKLRTDITIVDPNLIYSGWYPKYLKNEMNLKISFTDAALDTLGYLPWKSQTINIENPKDKSKSLTWELPPTYMDEYLLKGDRILLDIFKQNFFRRPIYFSYNSDSTYNLFLSSCLKDEGVVDRVMPGFNNEINETVSKNLYVYNIEKLNAEEIRKSPDAIRALNDFRWAYLKNIVRLINLNNYSTANELIQLMVKRFSKARLPFTSTEVENYFIEVFQLVDKDYGKD